MQFKKIIPSVALQPFVKYFWILQMDASDLPFSQHLLPYGWFELFFHLEHAPAMQIGDNGRSAKQPNSIFTGQFSKSIHLHYTKTCRCAGVSLNPWAGNALFNHPANFFADCITNVTDLDKKSFLREQLLAAKSEMELIRHFEDYLLQKLKSVQLDTVSIQIAKAILESVGVDAHKKVVESLGITRRRVEQRFLESTGVTIGKFVRNVRFEKVITLLNSKKQESLSQIGLEAGYYDQSHFIRGFRDFSGLRPKEFVKQYAKAGSGEGALLMDC